MSIEAMKQALDALESDNPDIQLRAAIALRQAIEQAERASKRTISYACPVCCASMIEQSEQQEPVAWYCKEGLNRGVSLKQESLEWEPLYTAPPKHKPLTDEEADELIRRFARYELLRAIEAAHGIGEKA